ncbi:LicD family protein [Paenalcaligenes hermetiae]|uniref:LicD family protein n=1 Tax=Paenalcaligenes hermetiae TaxID=1157987 RepID=A0ABP9LZA3_9BURK
MDAENIIKNALIETMDEFHRVCEENDLKYYLIGGSLIGAIRHKGCIPWDDDIDVIMPQKDFEKLLLLRPHFAEPFELQHRSFTDSLMLPIARVENKAVIIDEGYYSGMHTGVFIDVFCFNDTFSSKLLQRMHFKIAAGARLLLRFKDRTYSKGKYSTYYLKLFELVSRIFLLFPRALLNLLVNKAEKLGQFGGRKKYLANLHGVWKTKEIAPKSLFHKRKLYEFEGRQYWSIEDADAWLRPIYGDYMQLPPEEDRVPKHIEKIISINGVKVDS